MNHAHSRNHAHDPTSHDLKSQMSGPHVQSPKLTKFQFPGKCKRLSWRLVQHN